ncbi:uncharacterized protein F4807DRAFT_106367 [Annulohypoxylon truncatum]|uniref:uncharacterized protein n=1 Tax=Annulohypoxylon truncatum TaxID=327061 RepID=UPI0020072E2E|nr:uncharacterized protein F4807DRAFT_106367 [Annulohypoxylon truncatum]KAI1208993.1 hypothetical protein F4807DRAFT_106367 [Annulohypoxylon truncatum]
MTNQPQNRKGGNYSTSTIKGEAFFEETYINARWRWITLPLLEVLLAAIPSLRVNCIHAKAVLLKYSIMALLVGELGGWSEDELDMPRP